MKRALVSLVLCLCLAAFAAGAEKRVLVYTRNFVTGGGGYVHDNIQSSVDAIRKMGSAAGFTVDASDDPGVFSPENLRRYAALVFSNSNNEAFATDAQREAFRKYIEAGGGYAGIHIASGSERKWPFYWSIAGGRFVRHPKLQTFRIRVVDPEHPATRHLPSTFEWTDECYFHDNLNPSMMVLLATDPAGLDDPDKDKYPDARLNGVLPLAWYNTLHGGRQFFTALGHKKEHYADPLLYRHILGGITWVLGK